MYHLFYIYPDTGLQDLGFLLYTALNLSGTNPAGPHLHHLLHSVLEVEVALAVVVAQVASVSKALLSEEVLGVLLPVEISLHPGQTPHHQLPGLVRPQSGVSVDISDVGRTASHQGSQTSRPGLE